MILDENIQVIDIFFIIYRYNYQFINFYNEELLIHDTIYN